MEALKVVHKQTSSVAKMIHGIDTRWEITYHRTHPKKWYTKDLKNIRTAHNLIMEDFETAIEKCALSLQNAGWIHCAEQELVKMKKALEELQRQSADAKRQWLWAATTAQLHMYFAESELAGMQKKLLDAKAEAEDARSDFAEVTAKYERQKKTIESNNTAGSESKKTLQEVLEPVEKGDTRVQEGSSSDESCESKLLICTKRNFVNVDIESKGRFALPSIERFWDLTKNVFAAVVNSTIDGFLTILCKIVPSLMIDRSTRQEDSA